MGPPRSSLGPPAGRSSLHVPRHSLEAESMNRLNKSVISGVNSHAAAMDDSISVHGGYFPFKLTATLAALKIVGGCMLIGLGAAAMVQKAAYADTAAGIWSGVIVIISGVLGAYTVRTNALRLYVITFLVASLVSLLSSVLLIIYSATGLAKDANLPFGVTVSDNGEVVDVVENDVQVHLSILFLQNIFIPVSLNILNGDSNLKNSNPFLSQSYDYPFQ